MYCNRILNEVKQDMLCNSPVSLHRVHRESLTRECHGSPFIVYFLGTTVSKKYKRQKYAERRRYESPIHTN